MKIILNDKEISLPSLPVPTIDTLVRQENLPDRGIAIALNGKVIRKGRWNTTLLQEGDRVALLTVAFGG